RRRTLPRGPDPGGRLRRHDRSGRRRSCCGSLAGDARMKIDEGVRLSRLTTLGTGGPALAFARPETVDELQEALGFARERGLPVARSEERRVGKECRCRWAAEH